MLDLRHCAGFALVAARQGGITFPCRTRAVGLLGSVVMTPKLEITGSIAVGHGLSCSAACGILSDQGSNLCPLLWQTDSLPLNHQGSPSDMLLK